MSTPDDPADLSPEAIAALLEASARAVEAELWALGDEGGWRPAPAEWSANECVGHLIEAERRGFAGRIRVILAAPPDRPADLEAWDPPAVAAARGDDRRRRGSAGEGVRGHADGERGAGPVPDTG